MRGFRITKILVLVVLQTTLWGLAFGENTDHAAYESFLKKYQYFLSRDLDSSRHYLNLAESYSSRSKYEKGTLHCYYYNSVLEGKLGNLSDAIAIAQDGIERVGNKPGYEKLVIQLYRIKGIHYRRANELSKAEHCLLGADSLAQLIGDSVSMDLVRYNLATLYEIQDRHMLALEMYHNSLDFAIRNKDTMAIFGTFVNMATLLKRSGDHHSAMHYAEKCKSLAYEIGAPRRMYMAHGLLAGVHKSMGALDSALMHDSLSYQYAKIFGGKHEILKSRLNLGVMFNQMELYGKALDHLDKIHATTTNSPKLFKVYYHQSLAHARLGNARLALKHYELALGSLKEEEEKSVLFDFYRIGADVMALNDRYAEAYDLLSKAIVLQDSIYEIREVESVHKTEAKYQNLVKQSKIDQLKHEQQLDRSKIQYQRIQIVLTLFGCVILGLVALVYRIKRLRTQSDLRMERTNQELTTAKLKTVAQLNHRIRQENKILQSQKLSLEERIGLLLSDHEVILSQPYTIGHASEPFAVVTFSEIVYVRTHVDKERKKNYCTYLVCKNGQYQAYDVRSSLTSIASDEIWPSSIFAQPNQSVWVNIYHVGNPPIQQGLVVLSNGDTVEVARRKKDAFLEMVATRRKP